MDDANNRHTEGERLVYHLATTRQPIVSHNFLHVWVGPHATATMRKLDTIAKQMMVNDITAHVYHWGRS